MYQSIFSKMERKDFKLQTLFKCTGSDPFQDWKVRNKDGTICKVFDKEVKTFVLEMLGCNIENVFITSTQPTLTKPDLPFLNISMYYFQDQPAFSFELIICDACQNKRRIRYSTYNSKCFFRYVIYEINIQCSCI